MTIILTFMIFPPYIALEREASGPGFLKPLYHGFRLSTKYEWSFSSREEKDPAGVLVTTPEKTEEALSAVPSNRKLMAESSKTRNQKENKVLQHAIAAFKRFDYKAAAEAQQD